MQSGGPVVKQSGRRRAFRAAGRKWSFVLLGSAALAWFALRVIPKPSRASYPCQRIAAPLALTFLTYLISITGWAVLRHRALRYLRQRRYLPAALCLLCCLGVALIILWQTPSDDARAAFTPTDPPNSPIGLSRGIYPGRVVWSHDPDATDWDGLTGYWWEDSHTRQRSVDEMLSLSIRRLTGTKTDAEAWNALFRYFNGERGKGDVGYRPGEEIVVKINLNSSSIPSTVDSDYNRIRQIDYLDSSPQLTRAVLRQLVRVVGVNPAAITVGDTIRHLSNIHWDRLHGEFPEVCYLDPQGTLGRTKVRRSQTPFLFFSRGQATPDPLPIEFAEADYLINLACLKAHSMGGVTLCAKNHFGSLGRGPATAPYLNLHDSLPSNSAGMGKYRALVDLMGSRHLGGKTLLYVIDGLWAGPGPSAKPLRWNMAPFNNDWPSSLLVSQDPVAIDSVALDFLRTEWQLLSDSDDYLHEAAMADNPPSGTFYNPEGDGVRLASLGVHEHWNNANDKQYSGNLGLGRGIELVFSPPELRRIYLPHIANGQTGSQRLRTTFLLFNPSVETRSGNVALTADDGSALLVGIPMISSAARVSEFTFFLGPGESRMLETDGLGPLVSGAAALTCDGALGAAAIFSVDEGGLMSSEVAVGPSVLTSEFVVPVECKAGVATGLAVFNPDGDVSARVDLRLTNAAGQSVGDAVQLVLNPHQHLARFVTGSGQLFPSIGDFPGTLRAAASLPIVALTLRQNSDPLVYSTLPVYAISSPAKALLFPQVANGQYSQGKFSTSLTMFNFSPAAAQVAAAFTRDDGTQMLPSFSVPSLAAGASVRYETDGAGPLVAGAARVTSTQPVGVAASFTARDFRGRLITEAGVAGALAMTQFSVPVDLVEGYDTGLALLGSSSGSAELRMVLLESQGLKLDEKMLQLAANAHLARFVSEWFPGRTGLRGSLSITSSLPVAAVALRQRSFPYALTTLPVSPGAFSCR